MEIPFDKLRDYQVECVDTLNKLKDGNHLVVMATGLGKTVCMPFVESKGRILLLAHREELINQPVKYFEAGDVGFEQANRHSNGERVICASVQSLVRRLNRFDPDDFDVIITDEAHHAVAPSYKKIYDYFNPRLHLGFTATPNRWDKRGLGEVYSDIVFNRDIRWGIDNGWLTDIKCYLIDIGFDISKVKKQMDDFNIKQLAQAVDITEQNEAVAQAYYKYHKGQTLIFATTVQHAKNIASYIEGAVVVSADTPNRAEIIKAFTERKIPCIVNCMVFTEGTDLPLVETIINARPTQNPSLYAQIVGRGLRPYPGKDYLTLLDCVGISGKVDICTAPSLFGLSVTDKQYRKVNKDGLLLTRIEPEVAKHYIWRVNAQEINIFEETTGIDTHFVNYTKLPNGDMVVNFGGWVGFNPKEKGKYIILRDPDQDTIRRTKAKKYNFTFTVKNIDLTGKTSVILTQKIGYNTHSKESGKMPAQDAFDWVRFTLNKSPFGELFRSYWDTRKCIWDDKPASAKQKAFIQDIMNDELIGGVDYSELTMSEAKNIINILLNQKS